MRDEPYRPGEKRLTAIESAFVFTTVVVTAAFMLWFFVLRGVAAAEPVAANVRTRRPGWRGLIVEHEVGCCEVLLEVLDRGRARDQQIFGASAPSQAMATCEGNAPRRSAVARTAGCSRTRLRASNAEPSGKKGTNGIPPERHRSISGNAAARSD